jgi:hypothetical protein
MGKRAWGVLAGCLAIAGVALWLTFFRDSDEDRIKKVLVELAKIVMIKDGDTLISRTARLRDRLKDVVADDVRVDVTELSLAVHGRQELEDGAAKAGLVYQRADCEFASIQIKVDPAGTLATADAVALVTASRGGERKVDRRNVHFLLQKEGSWKISSVDVAAVTSQ